MNRLLIHSVAAIAVVVGLVAGPGASAAENRNETFQAGHVNINRTTQCGETNVNTTYQEGRININQTNQSCGRPAQAARRGEAPDKRANAPTNGKVASSRPVARSKPHAG